MDVFAEADKLTKMFHGALSVNETYDSDRSRWLSQTVKRYKGRVPGKVCHAGLFIRRTNAIGFELSARWAHEIVRSPFGRTEFVSVRQVDHGTEGSEIGLECLRSVGT